MSIAIGRTGRLYVRPEAAYNEVPSIALVTEAMRFTNAVHTWDPFGRVTSAEKKQSPGAAVRFQRKQAAALGSLEALVRPGGALNILPEADVVLDSGFGTRTNISGSDIATVASTASSLVLPGGQVTARGYVVGDCVLVALAAEAATTAPGPFVRMITAIAADTLTIAPALPSAPDGAADTVKGCITYKLTTLLAKSLMVAKFMYKNSVTPVVHDSWAARGVAIDRLRISFDEAEEPTLSASGPAANVVTTGHASMPADVAGDDLVAASTFIGAQNPPSGLTGQFVLTAGGVGVPYPFRTAELEITNNVTLRNTEFGVNEPTEAYRRGRREVSFALDAWAEDATALYDLAEILTSIEQPAVIQCGYTEGNIVAAVMPRVEFKTPTLDDGDEEITWSFSGMPLESTDGANDEVALVLA